MAQSPRRASHINHWRQGASNRFGSVCVASSKAESPGSCCWSLCGIHRGRNSPKSWPMQLQRSQRKHHRLVNQEILMTSTDASPQWGRYLKMNPKKSPTVLRIELQGFKCAGSFSYSLSSRLFNFMHLIRFCSLTLTVYSPSNSKHCSGMMPLGATPILPDQGKWSHSVMHTSQATFLFWLIDVGRFWAAGRAIDLTPRENHEFFLCDLIIPLGGGAGRHINPKHLCLLHVWFKGSGGPSRLAAVGNPEKDWTFLRYFLHYLSRGGKKKVSSRLAESTVCAVVQKHLQTRWLFRLHPFSIFVDLSLLWLKH